VSPRIVIPDRLQNPSFVIPDRLQNPSFVIPDRLHNKIIKSEAAFVQASVPSHCHSRPPAKT